MGFWRGGWGARACGGGSSAISPFREHGLSSSSPASTTGIAAEAEDQEFATKRQGYAEPAVIAAAAAAAAEGDPDGVLQKARGRLCILLALAELRSEMGEPRAAVSQGPSTGGHGGGDTVSWAEGEATATAAEQKVSEDAKYQLGQEGTEVAAGGPAMLARLARGAAEEFGVGAVERGVGYALAASDGRAVLGALRALLEEAEAKVKGLRDAAVEQGRAGGTAAAAVGRLAEKKNMTR